MDDAEKSLGSPTGISVGILAYGFLLLLVAFVYVLFKPIILDLIGLL